ncbi:MAG: hypothetical protein KME13_13075 [Myxacorys californica WJT36-NPBG1]|jgi:hypothetical protein|nr:hypothetical protein [Myxacorys californica WJT36-NPBG1]
MPDNGLTLQELSDNIRQKMTGDFEATKKAFEDLYKKSGVGDNLDVIRKNLEKQIKPVTDVVNDQKVKDFVKKPDGFFKKWIIDPIVNTFDKSILKPVAKSIDEIAFKPLSRALSDGFRAADRVLSGWLRPIGRSIDSAGQYLRRIVGDIKGVQRTASSALGTALETSRNVGRMADDVIPAVRVLGKISGTLLKVLPIIGLIFDMLSANEIFKAIEAQKTQLIALNQQGRDSKAAYDLMKIQNDRLALLVREQTAIKETLRRFNYTELDLRLDRIEGQLRNLGAGSQNGQKVDLSPLDSKLGVIQSQLDRLGSSSGQKVDLSPVQSQLNDLKASVARIPTTAGKVDLSPVQSQLNDLKASVARIPTTAGKVDLSPIQSQLTDLRASVARIPTTAPRVDLSPIQSQLTDLKASIARIPTTQPVIPRPDYSSILQAIGAVSNLLQPLAGIPPTLARIATRQVECCLEFRTGNNDVLGNLANALAALDGLRGDVNELKADDEVQYSPVAMKIFKSCTKIVNGKSVKEIDFDLQTIQVLQSDAAIYQALSDQLFALASAQCSRSEPNEDLLKRVYNILGGVIWFSGDRPEGLDPEIPYYKGDFATGLKGLSQILYDADGNAIPTASWDLIDLTRNSLVPSFYHAGLHRLPATVPTKIHLKQDETETTEKIDTLVDFQNWQFKQLDSALGYYPLNIKYKDATGTEKLIEIENLSEAISEIVGLLLSLDSDTDLISEVAIKNVGETVQNKAQISLAVDYLRAISDFLGFKFETGSKKLQLPIDPRSKSVKGFLEKSEVDIQSIVLKESDDNDIISKLNQLLIVTGMTRAAVTKKALAGKLDGDKIKEEIAESDDDWDKFIQYLNEIPAGLKNPGDATPKARDKTSYLSPTDQTDG